MPLINCDISLQLTWSRNSVITDSTSAETFAITDRKLYVPVVTLSTLDNTKLLEPLKLRFKRRISWNKHQSKVSTEAQNQYLDYLIDLGFQGINRLLLLSLEDDTVRKGHTYFLPTIEIIDHDVKINGQNVFDQQAKSGLRTVENIQKIATD